MECGKRCLLPLKFGTATNKMGRLHEEHTWVDHSEIQSIRTENAENSQQQKKWTEIRGRVCGRTERNVLNEMEKPKIKPVQTPKRKKTI